jgi:leader peptidase (prepilin peptidase)/N-methyltransferase
MFISLYYFFTFIAGTFFGSFLNVVADRILNGESIWFGRSHCDHCKKPLGPTNLIPILSFILQKGRCDKCNKKISIQYPLSEIATGMAFVLAAYLSGVFRYSNYASILSFIYLTVIFGVFIVMFITDLKERIIPNRVVYFGILFIALFIIFTTVFEFWKLYNIWAHDPFGQQLLATGLLNDQIMNAVKEYGVLLLSSTGIALFFAFLHYATKGRGMGGGDIKLGFMIGMVNRYPNNILAIFLGFVIGALISVGLIMIKRKSIKDTVPFGPFLIIGSLISLIYGSAILNWYFGII